jgi:hypothetical protein
MRPKPKILLFHSVTLVKSGPIALENNTALATGVVVHKIEPDVNNLGFPRKSFIVSSRISKSLGVTVFLKVDITMPSASTKHVVLALSHVTSLTTTRFDTFPPSSIESSALDWGLQKIIV